MIIYISKKAVVSFVTCNGIAVSILKGEADNPHIEPQAMPEIQKPGITAVASGGLINRLANGKFLSSSGGIYDVTFRTVCSS
jgi:hypothetical protein